MGNIIRAILPQRLPLILEAGNCVYAEGINGPPTIVLRTSHKMIKYIMVDYQHFVAIDSFIQPLSTSDFNTLIAESLNKINTPSIN